MTTSAQPTAAAPKARLLILWDTPSDAEAFERHYREVHIPLANQLPGLRRYTRSHAPTAVHGDSCYMVAALDWDDRAALDAALASEAGQATGADVANLTRYAGIHSMILDLADV
ncbi:EthD family reductase [Nocardia sp. NEAU-G5]|uniref:EthD family reductase n=1 Tax=Nocardia albiluteola TaxID=2842303 RepID=A0ABS6B9C8_9NOCA|nr:EthD family reductase [Nocardia albiluteola]MBU3066904.1 EthD family reductase [Nocardia albiluteola]